MVQVYLPMGYPLQSGNQFENVLYQGTVVRLYTLPTDPRTEAQLLERKFLSDVTKMRATMGTWMKALCKYSMGSKWGTVLYQAIKADLGDWWSSANADWDGLEENERDDWRELAPYQATFVDPGKIWLTLCREVYQALEFWGGHGWLAAALNGASAEDARTWWDGSSVAQWKQGVNDETDGNYRSTDQVQRVANQYAVGGYYLEATTDLEFAYFGKKFALKTPQNGYETICTFFLDGVDQGTIFYDYNYEDFVVAKKDFHIVKLVQQQSTIYLDAFKVY